MNTHDQDDGYDGEILELVALAKRIPEGLLHEVDTEQEDERADKTDGNVANHGWTGDPDGTCSSGKQATGKAAIASIRNEHHAVGVD